MGELLGVDRVTKTFGGGLFNPKPFAAVDEASFNLKDDHPEIVAIAGESGSGKTTLAKTILGIMKPNEGTIHYQGADVFSMSRRRRKEFRREVQAIFQDPFEVYNPFYKIDTVLRTPIVKFQLARNRQEIRARMESALETVGLRPGDTLGRYPHELSGGQRQRVMIARTLVLDPRVIVADEPVSMVDASMRAVILQYLMNLKEQQRISIIYITHDLTTALQIADRILVMYRGSVVEEGPIGDVILNPLHPYTQLLVASVPRPNPKERWENSEIVQRTLPEHGGCKFANRCPHMMEKCLASRPTDFEAPGRRRVACFLHERPEPVARSPLR